MMAAQPDGKIVLGGASTGWRGALVRLEPDGGVDRGFGTDGALVTTSPVQAVAVQPDGKIVAVTAGSITRYLSDGSLDRSFGQEGVAGFKQHLVSVSSVEILADGRIAVAGDEEIEPLFFHGGFVLIFSPDGRQQEVAGEFGALTGLAGTTQLGDGSIVVAGRGASPTSSGSWDGLLARVVPGAASPYDPSFGDGKGLVFFPYPGVDEQGSDVNGVAKAPGGILVAGGAGGRAALGRFDNRGLTDRTFGQNGFVTAAPPGLASVVANDVMAGAGEITIVGDGVAGKSSDASYGRCIPCLNPFVARFLSNGEPDAAFGNAGTAQLLRRDGTPVMATGSSLLSLADGSTVVSGSTTDGWDGFVLGKWRPDGRVDRSFGDGGSVTAYACEDGEVKKGVGLCIPRAKVKIRPRNLAERRPSLFLRVASPAPWMVIRAVRLTLPWPLHLSARGVGGLRAIFIDSMGREQLRRPKVRSHSLISGPHRWDVGAMRINLPIGSLARVKRGTRRQSLAFRVKVWFAAKQRIPVRQSFTLRRPG
jgi:uncharacterized delta-60 repeat protein